MRGYQPEIFTRIELLLSITRCRCSWAVVLSRLNLQHEILLWGLREWYWIYGIVRACKVVEREGVVEVIVEGCVQDVVLWLAVVSEKYGVELAAVLLGHPVEGVDVCDRRLCCV